MKPDIENTNPDHYPTKPRKPKSREVSSRFLSPPSSSAVVHDERASTLATLKQRSSMTSTSAAASVDARKQCHVVSQEDGALTRRLWPSTSSPKAGTLADQFGKERHVDTEKLGSLNSHSLTRQKSCTEFRRFENDNYQSSKISREDQSSKISREDHSQQKGVFGGSMRYTGKLFSKKTPPKASSYDDSINENAYRRRSLIGNSDSDCSGSFTNSPPVRPKKGGNEVSSRSMSFDRSPKKKSPKLKRANSMMTMFGSTTSKWAMSPGRSGSPPMTVENKGFLPMSFSSMKPPTSPSKGNRTKGVGSLLSKGLDLIKRKGKNGIYASSPSPLGTGSGMINSVHQLRINHNRLVQWRYANAKANNVNKIINDKAKSDLIAASGSVKKLQHSVVQKKIQLEKEKLQMKLYHVMLSQIESLKAWGDLERQHTSAVSTTKDCLHSVICRVPLVEGAKMDPHSSSFALRHASDLTTSVKSMLCANPSDVENTSTVCSELAEVVAQEKALLQEFSELFKFVSILEEEERSLKCCLILMKAHQQQQEIVS